MIAAIHVSPIFTIPAAIAAAVMLLWYWIRLGCAGVPRSRRFVRRMSLVVMLLSLPNFVRALSYLDPSIHKQQYVIAWSIAMLFVFLFLLVACVDIVVTMRIHRRQYEREVRQAGEELHRAIERDHSTKTPGSPAQAEEETI